LLDGYVLAAYLARTGDEPDPKMWFSRLDPFRIRNGISEDVPRSILATEGHPVWWLIPASSQPLLGPLR